MFEIYRSLTLQEAADILGRDKSSIHPHIQFLITVGLLQEPKRVDENRNNIYELAPDYDQKLRNLDKFQDYSKGVTVSLILQMIASSQNLLKMQKFLLEEEMRFQKHLQQLARSPQKKQEFMEFMKPILNIQVDEQNHIIQTEQGVPKNNSISSNSLVYFDQQTFLEFKQEYFALLNKYEDIQERKTNSDPTLRRGVCFIGHSLALEPILTLNTKKP